MFTQYIKVKANLVSFDEEIGEDIDIKLTRKLLKAHKWAAYELNRHLAIWGLINFTKFNYTGEIKMEDLIEYVSEGVDISDNITSIIPIHFSFEEIPTTTKKSYNDYMNEELNLYLYIKVISKKSIDEKEQKSLFEYVSGQLSDGWGEGFEQHSLTIESYDDDFFSIKCYVHFNWETETFQIVDEIKKSI